jgi:hypothetical protein
MNFLASLRHLQSFPAAQILHSGVFAANALHSSRGCLRSASRFLCKALVVRIYLLLILYHNGHMKHGTFSANVLKIIGH